MVEEFDLSEKEVNSDNVPINLNKFYAEKDVKEFIKRLKKEMEELREYQFGDGSWEEILDRLAGDKLIK